MKTPITQEPEHKHLLEPLLCVTCNSPLIVCSNCGLSWCPESKKFLNDISICQCCGYKIDIGDIPSKVYP